jgi:hypothetical protein
MWNREGGRRASGSVTGTEDRHRMGFVAGFNTRYRRGIDNEVTYLGNLPNVATEGFCPAPAPHWAEAPLPAEQGSVILEFYPLAGPKGVVSPEAAWSSAPAASAF